MTGQNEICKSCKNFKPYGYNRKHYCSFIAMRNSGDGYGDFPMGHSKCIHDSEGSFFEPVDDSNKQEYINELEGWKAERAELQREIDALKNRLTKI